MKPDFLEPFFKPRGVVILGACPKPENLGWRIVESLRAQGFPGTVLAIHPEYPEQKGGGYRSLENLSEEIDLAIAAVSAKTTVSLIEQVAQKGIHHLIAVSGGFAESGNRDLQEKMKTIAHKYNVRIVGPNGLGIFSAPDRFNSFFLSSRDISFPKPGSIGLISQSGAFLSMMLNQFTKRGIGVHRAINFGNRVDIGECDALENFRRDPKVQAIGIYLESFQSGERFFKQVQAITPYKPILIYKGGKGQSGARATQAHSASLAASYPVFQALCRQMGMIEVFSLNELIDGLQALDQPARLRGYRLLIVSNGGGMGVLMTDLCEPLWEINPPLPSIQAQLRQMVPTYYSLANPIDLTGSGKDDEVIRILEQLLGTDSYDALLLVLLPGTAGVTPELAKKLKDTLPAGFPIVVGAYGDELYEAFNLQMSSLAIPVYPSGEQAAKVINLILKARSRLRDESPELKLSCEFDSTPLQGWLHDPPTEMELKAVLEKCGVPVPRRFKLNTENLDEVSAAIGFPLVLKVSQSNLLHKTELNGVHLNIDNQETLVERFEQMNAVWPGNVWAEEQVSSGLDILVGLHRDETFGIIIVFGTGGEFAEIYEDVCRMHWPVSQNELEKNFQQTHVGRIAGGARGKPPMDISGLLGFFQLVATWMQNETAIRSLDFNPVRLSPDGFRVLDAKMTMEKRGDL